MGRKLDQKINIENQAEIVVGLQKDCGVQILRALLCIMIMMFHAGARFGQLFWGGIIAFFLISSYYLSMKILKSNSLSFFKQTFHRLKRLYPVYIVIIIIGVFDVIVRGGKISWDLIAYILSYQNILWRLPFLMHSDINMSQMMAHTWTLCIEVWMGMFWTFILLKIPKVRWNILCFWGIAWAVFWRIFIFLGHHHTAWIYNIPFAYTDIFALGTMLAMDQYAGENNRLRALVFGMIGSLGIFFTWGYLAFSNSCNVAKAYLLFGGSSYYLASIFTVNIYLYLGIFFYGIVYFVLHFHSISNKHIMVAIGNQSYELYLFHYPFLVFLSQTGRWRVWWINFLICFVGALTCSAIWKYAIKSIRKVIDHNDTFV